MTDHVPPLRLPREASSAYVWAQPQGPILLAPEIAKARDRIVVPDHTHHIFLTILVIMEPLKFRTQRADLIVQYNC